MNYETMSREILAMNKETLKQLQVTRSEILKELNRLGVVDVSTEYDGRDGGSDFFQPSYAIHNTGHSIARFSDATGRYDLPKGDQGQIEVVEWLPEELLDKVRDFIRELVDSRFECWDDEEGGFGEFQWSVPSDQIHLLHQDNVITTSVELRADIKISGTWSETQTEENP